MSFDLTAIRLNSPSRGVEPIQRFEHERLKIGDEGFEHKHWEAFAKLNTLHGERYFEVLHNGVKFKHFVGVIQVGGLVVEIHPKADRNDAEGSWKHVLLQMLRACNRLSPRNAGGAQLKRQPVNLLEIYFEAFLREIEVLVRHGLVKRYRKERGNVKALKGKLDFAGNIRHNLVHQERFYTVHQVYDVNHQLHQVLACALGIVDQFTAGTWLGDLCKRIRLSFPEVDEIRPTSQLLDSIQLDRKTSGYTRAFELARLIILNYSPDISGGNEKMIALLFDMNQLWEEYVRVKLRHCLQGQDDLQLVQESKPFWESNSLRPDMVIRSKSSGETFIIDTKWKLPDKASIQDVRQMYAYGRFWDAERILLLYPGSRQSPAYSKFLTDDYRLGAEGYLEVAHQCRMGFVSVSDGDRLDPMIGEKVLRLVMGTPEY